MGRRRSLIGERLLEAIPWHWAETDPIVEEMIHLVPPGEAHRRYMDRIEKENLRSGRELNTLPTETQRIFSGARSIINDRMGSLLGIEVERRVIDGVRQVRRIERRQRPIGLTADEARLVAHGTSFAPIEDEQRLIAYLESELDRVTDGIEVQ